MRALSVSRFGHKRLSDRQSETAIEHSDQVAGHEKKHFSGGKNNEYK